MDHEHGEREDDEDAGRPRQALSRPGSRRGWRKWVRIPLAAVLAIGAMASLADLYREVRAGKGGELHRSLWGYKVSPVGVLVGLGVALVAYAALSLVGWLLERRDRAWADKRRRKRT